MKFETISVIGLGYIGLPTAAMFASRKVKVIGVDVNEDTVEIINSGKIHIVEPDLDIVVHSAVSQGYLSASTKTKPADAFLIAVPTPFKDDHEPDLKYIKAAAHSVAEVLKKGDLVILESTSPVGATEKLSRWMAESRPDLTFPDTHGDDSDIRVAHCPERVLPGHVMRELIENDRVIGGISSKCSEYATQLYKTFVTGDCVVTNARTAEMAKLTENSFRDVNIAFANELSIVCDKLDINVWELIQLANRHPRVNILQPGPGVGGHCIAVDPWFIVSKSPESAKIIRCAREVNDSKPEYIVNKVKEALLPLDDAVVACFGISFKPNIDDLRESPSLEIVKKIAQENIDQLHIVEPNITSLPIDFDGVSNVLLSSIELALNEANIILILVNHKEFEVLSQSSHNNKVVIDACGAL